MTLKEIGVHAHLKHLKNLKNNYVWNNADASDLFHNPYFRRKEGNWTPQRRKEVVNNIKNGKRWFDNN